MRKNLYISDDEVEVIKKLFEQRNASGYIVDLIKQDIEGRKLIFTQEELKKLIIDSVVKENKKTLESQGLREDGE